MKNDTSKVVDLDNILSSEEKPVVIENTQPEPISVDWDSILAEWSYRCPKGYPTVVDGEFTEREEVEILNEILEGEGLSTLPLPEATPKIKVEYAKGFKNTTDTKEGLVMYFASLEPDLLAQVEEKLTTNPSAQIKLPTNYFDDTMYASTKDMISNIKLLSTTKLPFQKTDKEHYINGITSGKYLQKMYGGPIPPNLIDRGTYFYQIRNRAIELVGQIGIKLSQKEQDKWCPADIFIYANNPPIDNLSKIKYLNQDTSNLNSFFMHTFHKPVATAPILAISLKEEEARAGKATSFTKTLEEAKDYPKIAKNKELERLKDAITQLNAFQSKIKKESEIQSGYGELSDAYNSLLVLSESKRFGLATQNLLPVLNEALSVSIGKTNVSMGKDKVKKLKKIKPLSAKSLASVIDSINLFVNEAYNNVYAAYRNANNTFVETLNRQGKGTYEIESSDIQKSNKGEKDVANKLELLLKKANCYIVADDLIKNLPTKLKIPPAFKSLAREKNPFIALAAFGMSQAGISPTFFKIIGKTDLKQSASMKPFPSDGVVRLSNKAKVKIMDSEGFKGIRILFKVSQFQGKTRLHDYQVDLGFLYSGTQFKIEINRIE